MNTQANGAPEAGQPQRNAPAPRTTRPMYWSVRRELWENRSIYIAPVVMASFFLFGFLISTIRLTYRMNALAGLDPASQHTAVSRPYGLAAGLILLTAVIVGVFYCLDALHGERRDRSILFWKSLPVSDRTTVLSKAIIPLVVMPLLIFAIIVATQLLMLFLSTVRLLGNGPAEAMLWTRLPLFQMALGLLYALIAMSLWYAPFYAWLLLVSAWARRAAFLWAFLPPVAIAVVEKIAWNTRYMSLLMKYRLDGWFREGFNFTPGKDPIDPLTQLTPGRFLSAPGLWIGLIAAALFLAAAIWLRRYREPN